MKPTILLIGKTIRTIQVELADDQQILTDEEGRKWLDIVFDGGEVEIAGLVEFDNGFKNLYQTLRALGASVVMTQSDSPTTRLRLAVGPVGKYLAGGRQSDWRLPEFVPDQIVITKEAELAAADLREIKQFVRQHDIKLIVELEESFNVKLILDALAEQISLGLFDLNSLTLIQQNRALANWRRKIHDDVELIGFGERRVVWAQAEQAFELAVEFAKLSQAEVLAAALLAFESGETMLSRKLHLLELITNAMMRGQKFDFKQADLDKLIKQPSTKIQPVGQNSSATKLLKSPESTKLITSQSSKQADLAVENAEQAIANQKIWLDMELSEVEPQLEPLLVDNLLAARDVKRTVSHVVIPAKLVDATTVTQLVKDGVAVIGRADTGREELLGFAGEQVSTGLETLPSVLAGFSSQGVMAAKWSADFKFNPSQNQPSDAAILSNSHLMARFVNQCQRLGMMSIVDANLLAGSERGFEDWLEFSRKILLGLRSEMELLKVDFSKVIWELNLGQLYADGDFKAKLGQTLDLWVDVLPPDLAGLLISDSHLPAKQCQQLLATTAQLSIQLDLPVNVIFHDQALAGVPLEVDSSAEDRVLAQQRLLQRSRGRFSQNLAELKTSLQSMKVI